MDAIETVAQALADRDGVSSAGAWREHAKVVIAAFHDLGIPVDKLLSGEMVAWPVRETLETLGTMTPEEIEAVRTRLGSGLTRKLAQADYALNADVVTPE